MISPKNRMCKSMENEMETTVRGEIDRGIYRDSTGPM